MECSGIHHPFFSCILNKLIRIFSRVVRISTGKGSLRQLLDLFISLSLSTTTTRSLTEYACIGPLSFFIYSLYYPRTKEFNRYAGPYSLYLSIYLALWSAVVYIYSLTLRIRIEVGLIFYRQVDFIDSRAAATSRVAAIYYCIGCCSFQEFLSFDIQSSKSRVSILFRYSKSVVVSPY